MLDETGYVQQKIISKNLFQIEMLMKKKESNFENLLQKEMVMENKKYTKIKYEVVNDE